MPTEKSAAQAAIVAEIDAFIRTNRLWFDFHVFKFEHNKLIIAGSTDLSYYHEMEIIFENVLSYSGPFSTWMSKVDEVVFEKLDTQDHHSPVFRFKTDTPQEEVIIAAEKVSYNTNSVLYYYREDVPENAQLAYFVKPPQDLSNH